MEQYYLVSDNSMAAQIARGVYRIQLLDTGLIRFQEGKSLRLNPGKYTIVSDDFGNLSTREFISN